MTASRASFWEAAKVALDSLRASKLRSFLTLLGIILSTTTLIAVQSVFHGMDVYVEKAASDMGTEGFRVLRFAFINDWDPKKFLEYQRKNPQLNPVEFEFLQSRLTLSKESGLSAQRGVTVAYDGDLVRGVVLLGNAANGALMTNTEIETGRYFTETEVNRKLPVAFIGWDIKERFFPNVDPIGKTISLDGRPFQVIGVGVAKGSVFGESQDRYVSIPVQTYFKMYGSRNGVEYNFQAVDKEHMQQAQDEIRVLLRAYRQQLPGEDDTFAIVSSGTLMSAWNDMTGTIKSGGLLIVGIFLIVGGVVIMNIMLAVVSERTREIGIRKSLGARRSDILNQFLVESATLAGMGGLIGVAIAWIMAILVRMVTPVPMELPWYSVMLGVGLSATVGLFFGIYPSWKASKLDPIVALRAES